MFGDRFDPIWHEDLSKIFESLALKEGLQSIYLKNPGACGEFASDASDALLRFYSLLSGFRIRNETTPNITELNNTMRYDAVAFCM